MAQVPMRMAQPGLVPPHQQRPPMMVSMTQPPPASMQGLVSMAPMMGPGGGMAVMTQAMSHPDSGHDHHSMNGPYHHPHHHHPSHANAPRPHPPPQSHHQVPPPPHHPSGPPPQSTHSAPPHSQYHQLTNMSHHGPPHGHGGPHAVHHASSHNHNNPHPGSHMASHSTSNGVGAHNPHGIPQQHMQSTHMNQPTHSMAHHSASIQMNNMSSGNMNSNQSHMHQHLPQQQHPPPPPHQQHQQTMHQHMQHNMSQSQAIQQPPQHIQHQQHSSHHQQAVQIHSPSQHQQPSHAVLESTSGTGGMIILSNTNNVTGIPNCNNLSMGTNQNVVVSSCSPNSSPMVNGISNIVNQNGIDNGNETDSSETTLSTREKTPMCLINELARYNKIQHQYCLTDEKGPAHKKIFTVTLRLGDNEEEYSASGASIKKAQHAAAALALEKTKFKHPPPKTQRQCKQTKLTPTVELNALAMKRGEAAIYTFMETPRPPNPYAYNMPPNLRAVYNQKYYGRPPVYPMFFVTLKVGSREFSGEGATAQQAKHNAASKALKIVKSLPMPDASSGVILQGAVLFSDLSELDPNADLKSPISLVHEIALKRSLTVQFEVIRESGPPHMRTFVTTCIVGDLRTQGEGTGKKISKKRAAELMLEELKKMPSPPSANLNRVKRKPTTKKKSRNLIKVGQEVHEDIGSSCGGELSVLKPYDDGSHLIENKSAVRISSSSTLESEQKAAPEYGQGINPISRLIQIQQAKKEKEPIYTLIAERGVPRRREFVMQVTVGNNCAQGSGPNKKLAKRAAAESMLQLLGYSRPQPQPGKPAIKMDGTHAESDKTRKQVTFSEETSDTTRILCADSSQSVIQNQSIPTGSGRQLVPGLIMMPDGSSALRGGYQSIQQPGMNLVNVNKMVNMQATAAIAKELLESGSSATAKAISKKQTNGSPNNQQVLSHQHQSNAQTNSSQSIPNHLNHQIMQSPTAHSQPTQQQQQHPSIIVQQQHHPQQMQSPPPQVNSNSGARNGLTISGNTSGQAVRPKDQLMYLANILNLQVQFTDFPKGIKSEYLSLVSLSTMPPHVSHGAGTTIDASHDQACLNALKALAEMGLDTVTSGNRDNSNSN